jgi:hypothetical protein
MKLLALAATLKAPKYLTNYTKSSSIRVAFYFLLSANIRKTAIAMEFALISSTKNLGLKGYYFWPKVSRWPDKAKI